MLDHLGYTLRELTRLLEKRNKDDLLPPLALVRKAIDMLQVLLLEYPDEEVDFSVLEAEIEELRDAYLSTLLNKGDSATAYTALHTAERKLVILRKSAAMAMTSHPELELGEWLEYKWHLSTRARNAVFRSVEDLRFDPRWFFSLGDEPLIEVLRQIRNFGPKSITEVIEARKKYGWKE